MERTLEPYGLVLKNGGWYVVAAAARGMRTYRVSNILQLTPTDGEFSRLPGFDLAQYWQDHLDEFERRRFTDQAVVRISARLVPRLTDLAATSLLKAIADRGAEPDAAGNITVAVPIESVSNAVAQLVRFGAGLEVLEPQELRDEFAQLARTLLDLYSAKEERNENVS